MELLRDVTTGDSGGNDDVLKVSPSVLLALGTAKLVLFLLLNRGTVSATSQRARKQQLQNSRVSSKIHGRRLDWS